MRSAIAPVSALLLSVAILLTGNGLQGILLPVRAQIEAFLTMDIGIMGSAYYLGFAVGCLFTAHLVRLVGHIRSFTAMICVASSVTLGHALFLNPFVWWPLRAVTGFCFAGLFMVIESWLNERSTNENRGMIFSIYTIITLTVVTGGQLMVTVSDPASFTLFCLVGILISIAAVPVALTTAQAPTPISNAEIRLKHIYRLSPVGFFGCLVVGLAKQLFLAARTRVCEKQRNEYRGRRVVHEHNRYCGGDRAGADRLCFRQDGSTKGDRSNLHNRLFCRDCDVSVQPVMVMEPGDIHFPHSFSERRRCRCIRLASLRRTIFASPDEYVEVASGLLLIFAVGASYRAVSDIDDHGNGRPDRFVRFLGFGSHGNGCLCDLQDTAARSSSGRRARGVFSGGLERQYPILPGFGRRKIRLKKA